MGDEKAQRFEDALSSLVDVLVPALPDEDEDAADDRHEDALEHARDILEKQGSNTSVVANVQHAADLIKKKLRRDHKSPEQAIQFSNLYTRLLTQPVLSQKWGILYLLYQLADADIDDGAADAANTQADVREKRKPSKDHASDDQTFKDAFAGAGLPQLPSHQRLTRDRPESVHGHSSRSRDRRTAKVDDVGAVVQGKTGSDGPSEAALLRDLPFTLQGLSANNLPFSSPATLDLPQNLPLPMISILHTLAEPSLLYRNLSDFVQSKGDGLIGQSLRSAISSELRSYLGLISTLESEIRQAIVSLDRGEQEGRVNKAGVTLKRCVIWTREATMGLRLMSLMVEEAKSRKGGQLISMIHGFSTSHGDPFVGAFAERMLSRVTRPFYDMLRQWIYDGELSDPYQEFLVIENTAHDAHEDPRRAAATSVWEEKYKLDDTMIPSIITEDFAHKVFLIGKSLNFIRYSCGDSAWVEAYCKEASRELKYGDTATLETSIDRAYKTTMARLIYLMDDKFHLFAHLNALKRYLLLGQGDFVALLMESLSSNLDRPAGSQYRHTLTAQLEHAIRNSNAQYDSPDILCRLDARLTEMEKGDTGWDVFTLEYKVDAPVDVIITPWANRQYLKIFNLLWRVKRVEFGLGSTWRRCITGARGVLAIVDSANMGHDWKFARCAIAEMIHFVNQLQYYILFEVIEASWDTLHTAVLKPDATLDDMISAHTKYLRAITHKGLLGSVRTNSQGHKEDVFTTQLHELLKIMLAYKEAVDGLYSFSVAEFIRRQELAAKIETRTAQGKWGLTEADEVSSPNPHSDSRSKNDRGPAAAAAAAARDTDSPVPAHPLASLGLNPSSDDAMLPALRKRLSDLSAEFKTRLNNLLGDLAVQPDIDMKFLGVVMNFNDVYTPRKRRRERPGGEKKTPGQGGGGGGGETMKREDDAGGGDGGGGGGRTVSAAEEKRGPVTGGGAIGAALKAAGKEKGREGERKVTR